MPSVAALELPFDVWLLTRRGALVQVRLSGDPRDARRTYLSVPDGAGEVPAGVWSTSRTTVLEGADDDWVVAVELEPEADAAPVRRDIVRDDDAYRERDLLLALRREALEGDEVPAREGDEAVNPYGTWALGDAGAAVRIEVAEGEAGTIWVEALTRYGAGVLPWPCTAEVLDEEPPATVRLYAFGDAARDEGLWRIGSRAEVEAVAGAPLPDFDPGQWMRWLTPVDGGDPVSFGGFWFPGPRTIELTPVMPEEPAWANGRVLTIPMPRPGVAFESEREVTVSAKPHAELRSSSAKVRKRPPVPIGRFVLHEEGWMPEGWSALG